MVNPVTAISICFKKYFNIKGRASRSEFWWFFLLYISFITMDRISFSDEITIINIIGIIGGLVTIIPFITVSIRRVHDQNMTGWVALAWFVPIIMIIVAALPGTKGSNRFGPDPIKYKLKNTEDLLSKQGDDFSKKENKDYSNLNVNTLDNYFMDLSDNDDKKFNLKDSGSDNIQEKIESEDSHDIEPKPILDKGFSEAADALLEAEFNKGSIDKESYLMLISRMDNGDFNNLESLKQAIDQLKSEKCVNCGSALSGSHICVDLSEEPDMKYANFTSWLSLGTAIVAYLLQNPFIALLGLVFAMARLFMPNRRRGLAIAALIISVLTLGQLFAAAVQKSTQEASQDTSWVTDLNNTSDLPSYQDSSNDYVPMAEESTTYEMYDSNMPECWNNSLDSSSVVPVECGIEQYRVENKGDCLYPVDGYEYFTVEQAGYTYCLKSTQFSVSGYQDEYNYNIEVGEEVEGYKIVTSGSCNYYNNKKDGYEYVNVDNFCGEKYVGMGLGDQYNYNLSPGETIDGYTLVSELPCRNVSQNMGSYYDYYDVTIGNETWCAYR